MIFPLGTDAPIYHRPIGTIGLIVLNVAAFFASLEYFGQEDWERYQLAVGQGVRPLQWISHGFLHADVFHLAGNMIFLWSFGLIVEGKVGLLAFLGIYLGLEVLAGAAIQATLLGADPDYALGASGVIYGLMGMVLIWAPRNELSVFYLLFVGFRILTGVKEVAIYLFAIFYIGWEFASLFFTGLTLSSALGHATGAIWGLLLGTVLVRSNLVDCEDWDLFSLRRKRRLARKSGTGSTRRDWTPKAGKRRDPAPTGRIERAGTEPEGSTPVPVGRGGGGSGLPSEARIADARRRVAHMLDQQMATAALQAHLKAVDLLPGYRLEEAEHLRLIRVLLEQGLEAEAVGPMREFIARHPSRAHRVRLRLAQFLIDRQERPLAASRILEPIPAGALPENLEALRSRLLRRAEELKAEGVLEVEGDD
ncbi:rhomboid family intramembrane serine protease [Tautonia plasticadhaerens]|uniref:Rhomboid family protein n=1 Tax=Tautonia plasticadhaerens TaxID=2527974 RepID=A0A518HAW1_9BACT|nr:rhomboid family intramembrane serine protease [Tautonia plasticadhaerens]QDV37998.1 Rhomboid family protein [Tautonia plasticadhaerens]